MVLGKASRLTLRECDRSEVYAASILAAALVCLASRVLFGESAAVVLLAGVLLTAGVADLRSGIIPDTLNLAGAAAAILLSVSGIGLDFSAAFAGAVLCGGLLCAGRWLGIVLFRQPGIGLGDVKLACVIGLYLGPTGLWALYLGIVCAALFGATGMWMGRVRSRQRLAFAPFIAAGVLLAEAAIPFELVMEWLW
jgi:leader peptidase (prepilin peptidase) / N-methyltransferase